MQDFEFQTSPALVCRMGAHRDIAAYCARYNIRKPLVVTDPGIVALGLHSSLLAGLEQQGLTVALFKEVEPDPSEATVLSALAFARDNGVDGVIGFGGGSSLDVAKLVAALCDSEQCFDQIVGVDKLHARRCPLIQIPTTAGTGSEVTPVAIITRNENSKVGIVSAHLLPELALLDAELTICLPAAVTAATGIDAMVHAIEAYTSKIKKNPYSDMLARQALRLMSANIEAAVVDGSNLIARRAMMLGATLAGQAFANAPVAAVHALAYPLGSHFHIPHGLSNALVLPHVMRFNLESSADLYAQLATIIIPEQELVAGSDEQLAQQLTDYLALLIKRLKLPSTLQAMDIGHDQLGMLAVEALKQQRLLVNNPKALSEADALAIYQSAYC